MLRKWLRKIREIFRYDPDQWGEGEHKPTADEIGRQGGPFGNSGH